MAAAHDDAGAGGRAGAGQVGLLAEALAGGGKGEVVAWVDDDAFVQQLGVHPAEWLEGGDVAIGNQTNGVLNTGVLVLRNTPWTRGLVRAWLTDPACEGFKRSPRCGGGESSGGGGRGRGWVA